MAPLSYKKDHGTSKSGFALKDQSVTLNFELSYNKRTLNKFQSYYPLLQVFRRFWWSRNYLQSNQRNYSTQSSQKC